MRVGGGRLQELSILAAALWLRVHSGGRWPKSRCSASSGTVSRCTSVPIHSTAFDLAVKLSGSQIKLNDAAVKQFLRLWVKCSFFFFFFFFLLNSFSCLSAACSCGTTTFTWPWPSSPRSHCSWRTSRVTREPRSSTGECRRRRIPVCRTRWSHA